MRLTELELTIMSVLWSGERFALGEVTEALRPAVNWSTKTVYTYLVRMGGKGVVAIDKGRAQPYSAAVTREELARRERDTLLTTVYEGAAGDLLAAFLKESSITKEERARLRKLLDEMEV